MTESDILSSGKRSEGDSVLEATERHGLKLGQLFGIEIYLDASIIIIFSLVVAALALSVFPSWHSDWNAWLSWSMGLAAGVLFFASLLAHELAHSVVARRLGLPVPRITLFLFGGVSEMEDEPETPASEFAIAIVGPLTSLLLGFLFGALSAITAGTGFSEAFGEDPQQAIASLGPLPTLLLWLGPINLLLGIFNLLPGFPLDGGRVLRAAAWWATGDHQKATRWASAGGRVLGWAILAVGMLQIVAGALISGVGLILIGWFLSSSAVASYRQLLTRNALAGCRARDLMRTEYASVPPDLPLARFVEEHLMQSGQAIWPVEDDDRPVGYVSLAEVKGFDEEQRSHLTVSDVMNEEPGSAAIDSGRSVAKALRQLARRGLPLMVLADGHTVGLLSESEIMKWLALHPHDARA